MGDAETAGHADAPSAGERLVRSPLLRHPVAVGLALFLLFGLLHVLAQVAGVVLLGFLAVLLATLLSYPIELFGRFMPRPLALIVTIALVGAGVVGLGLAVAPVVVTQGSRLAEQIPVAVARLSALWEELRRTASVPDLPGPGLYARLVNEAEALLSRAVPFAMSVGSVLATAFLVFVMALFLAYAPASYLEGVRALVPREHEPLLDEAWRRLGATLRHWTTGILLSMLIMGSLAALGLALAGIDGWLLLGLLTFLGTFVPYVGAIASAVPGLLVGLAQSPRHFVYALLVYVLVHLVEGYVVGPFIMRYSVRLRPGVLLFWQLLIGALLGLPGVVVATPLLACTQVAVGFFYVERRLGKPPPLV